jgi:asparagine synthase (glutamine-hydrolysing)
MPKAARNILAGALASPSPDTWDRLMSFIGTLLPAARQRHPGEKIHKIASLLSCSSPQGMYRTLISTWQEPADIVLGACASIHNDSTALRDHSGANITEFMAFADLTSYLPEDVLTKVDRASMAVGLEARVPLLDHRIVEFSWRLPSHLKLHAGTGKHVLRQVLYRYVPRQLIERPKTGFGVPIARWLRNELRDWAEGLLSERRIRDDGFLRPSAVKRCWQEHLSGARNRQYQLWNLLMFQAWLDNRRS